MSTEREFDGRIADLYDVFVDWPSRLGREMPGIEARLRTIDARRVLDVGCGTGRHVGALLERGFDAFGSDSSASMLAQARQTVGDTSRFTTWRLEDPLPPALSTTPFDAVLALGNVWPQLVDEGASEAAFVNVRGLLRDGGLLLLGLKAFAIRRDTGQPYLPLLRRTHDGAPLFFVRFFDFAVSDDPRRAAMHFAILGGGDGDTMLDHRVAPVRVWSPDELADAVRAAGFDGVKVSGSIGDPDAPVTSEDVYVHARA